MSEGETPSRQPARGQRFKGVAFRFPKSEQPIYMRDR